MRRSSFYPPIHAKKPKFIDIDSGMLLAAFIYVTYVETKINDIGEWFRAVDIYCCKLDSVVDLGERSMTARVAMRCQYHNAYSFEVVYGQSSDLEDSALIEQIASGIVNNRS